MNGELQECMNCKHEKVKTYEEPCYACIKKGQRVNWESPTTIFKKEEPKKEEEQSCNGCKHAGKTAFEVPCNECTRRRKDLFEVSKKLVKRTYYFTSWPITSETAARGIGHFATTDREKIYKPEGREFQTHSIEIEEEE